MSKFKVGDVVRVKSLDECSKSYCWSSCMNHWCDKLMTIKKIDGDSYKMEEDYDDNEGGWFWKEDVLDPVTYFTKDDFKTGMTVEVRCGERFVVWGKRFIYDDGWNRVEDLNDSLCNINNNEYDVMEIFSINKNLVEFDDILNCPGNVIWKRKEEKEISSEEAFKVLKEYYGCDVKIKE